jgi:hypothetical protein
MTAGVRAVGQQLGRIEAKAQDRGPDLGPLFLEKSLALILAERFAGAFFDKHATPPALLHKPLVDEFLVSLQDGQGIDVVVGRHTPHAGKRIAVADDAVEDHGHDPIPQLTVNGLVIVPVGIHGDLRHPPIKGLANGARRCGFSTEERGGTWRALLVNQCCS